MAVPKPVQTAVTAVRTVFWTAAYFVYFLFKGKQEWKCGKASKPSNITYCCVDGSTCADHQNGNLRQRRNQAESHINHDHDIGNGNDNYNHNTTPKSFYTRHTGIRGFLNDTWHSVKRGAAKAWDLAKKIGKKVWNGAKTVLRFIWQFLRCVFAFVSALLLSSNVPSQALPSTPKPYTAKPSSPSYNKVAFQFEPIQEKLDESELQNVTKQEIEEEEERTIYEDVPKSKVPDTSESFYYERVFDEPPPSSPAAKTHPEPPREKSVPPPPPPPPPKPVSISREPSRARSMTPGRATTPGGRDRREVKGGIGGFKSDIMDELEEQQRLRQERGASAQREMTQSCHPDMAQWKHNEAVDRSANSTPWRASSVGPTMRKLEQVVSRIDGNDDKGEANFVFRPKIVHSSEEYQNKNRATSDYLMGRSVFTPLEEAEQIRPEINNKHNSTTGYYNYNNSPQSQQHSYSSPQYQNGNWMENQRSRNVRRNDQAYDYQAAAKNPFGSAAYKSSPYASHTARRSKTPVRHGEPEGGVETIARQWPPNSNATGVVGTARDEWIGNSMRRPEDANDDGLIMTMCRRVVEKKRDENWKWRDESGRLLDEKNQNTWKGELDTLLRDGPNEGRHWSRTVEKMPTGDTRFQDVNRQYNREFVVESVVRNY